MAETEGVIRFNLGFHEAAPATADVGELSAWRTLLRELGLLGQSPDRYGGYGFGNVSRRCRRGFIISGTQTGALDWLTPDDYALCEGWDLTKNAVTASGRVKPSSESLSHAAVYDAQTQAGCALHAHSPEIWRHARQLGIAVTDEAATYGTPEMAAAVGRLIEGMALPGIFAMGGHEDGVFTFGRTPEEAGLLMIRWLVRARRAA